MKTKIRILLKALELFNEKGVRDITLRQIANSLQMSQGNLNYHFRTKAEIISDLYFKMVEQTNVEMDKVTRDSPILYFLSESALVSMNLLYRYRFIVRDLYYVLGSDEILKTHYLQLQEVRKQQYLMLFQNLIREDLMREEELEGEFVRLYERMNILGDNWINVADFFGKDNNSKVAQYHALLFEVIYPYLTEKGKEQYRELIS